MRRYLIVANQTLGSDALEHVVRARVDRGVGEFYIVVPIIPAKHETSQWDVRYSLDDVMASAVCDAMNSERWSKSTRIDARRRASQRLAELLERIEAMGAVAEGEVGEGDPVAAVKEVLASRPVDEVIVSMLPENLSRWMKIDLPCRIARITDVPVTTVATRMEPDRTA